MVLTSLRVTREAGQRAAVLDLDTVLVLIDLPLRAQVRTSLDQDFTARFGVLSLGADAPVNLVDFHLDELPSRWFLSFRSDAGFGEMSRLFDEHADALHSGLTNPAARPLTLARSPRIALKHRATTW